jgi:hypothetical protein
LLSYPLSVSENGNSLLNCVYNFHIILIQAMLLKENILVQIVQIIMLKNIIIPYTIQTWKLP